MKTKHLIISAIAFTAFLTNCEKHDDDQAGDHGHDHGSETADPHGHDHPQGDGDHDHGEEIALGKFKAGELEIEAAQGHGMVEAGKEGHLIIKLPYKDDGATVVRAWIGTEDRTLSAAGKGEYAPSHDDYDIHATAPSPLPADTKWWVEVEKPDGTKIVGSITPKM